MYIKHESVPGINQYKARGVNFVEQGGNNRMGLKLMTD